MRGLDDLEISPETFAQRQAWARRHGRWLWLWPDIAPADWRHALDALEVAIGQVLAGRTARLGGPRNLAALSLACYTSGTGPLIGHWVERGIVDADPEAAALVALHLHHNRRRMAAMKLRACEAVATLASQRVYPTVLKGMHLACSYYPEPGTRPVSDLDLLVCAPEAQARAKEALALAGFELISANYKETTWAPGGVSRVVRSLLLVHADDPWTIDLHHSIDQKPASGVRATSLDRRVASFFEHAWPPGASATTLAQPALLLHLASHAGSAIRVNLSLVRVVDLVLVIRADTQSGKLDWRAFLDLGAESGSLGLAYATLALSEKLVPGTVPSTVLRACETAAPPRLRRLVDALTPAGAQRLDRASFAEHFLWARGPIGFVRQIGADFVPDMPWREMPGRYGALARRMLLGGFSR